MSSNRYPGVYKRGKTWSFRSQFGDGDQRWGVSGSGYLSARDAFDARNRAADAARPLHGVTQKPDATMTLAKYLYIWLDDHTRTLRPGTASAYRSRVNGIAKSPVAGKRLRSLTEADYRRLVGDLKAQSDGHRTLVLKVGTLSTALDAAVRAGLISNHPLRAIKITRSTERFEPGVWDLPTVTKFLANRKAANDPLYPAYHLAVVTGLRRGELHGLRREDFDLDKGMMYVRRQRVEINGRLIELAPKTSSSEAPVYLDAATVDLIREHVWVSDYFVTEPRTGRPYAQLQTFTKGWKRACKAAGVPVIRFHDLRHTSASLLADSGVPLVLAQARLRHWSSAMTARYTHVLDGRGSEVADTIGALLTPVPTLRPRYVARRPDPVEPEDLGEGAA